MQGESGDMCGGFASLRSKVSLRRFPHVGPIEARGKRRKFRKRTPQADFFDTPSPRKDAFAGCSMLRGSAARGRPSRFFADFHMTFHFVCVRIHIDPQTVKNPSGRFGGPKPSKCNPNPATCAADSETLLRKVSLRCFPPGSPTGREGNTVNFGKGRLRRTFSAGIDLFDAD